MLDHLLHRWLGRDPDALMDFALRAAPLLDRALALRTEWLALAAAEDDPEQLANAAAIQRWALAQLADELQTIVPSQALRARHSAAVRALLDACRAAQWTSAGYRFHHGGKVCDGRALSEEAFAILASLRDDLQRRLRTSAFSAGLP